MLISAWSASLLALSPSIFLEIGSKDYPLLSATSLVGLALLMQMTLIGNVCLFTAHNCFLAFFSFGLIVSGAAGGLFVYLSCIVEASDPQLLLFVACGAVGCSLVIWVIQLLKVILCWPEAKQLENP